MLVVLALVCGAISWTQLMSKSFFFTEKCALAFLSVGRKSFEPKIKIDFDNCF